MRYFILFSILFLSSCAEKPKANSILADCVKLKTITQAKHPVKPGEWRERYTEIQEPLKFYLRKGPPKANTQRSKLYVVRLGPFDAKGAEILGHAKEYLGAFYQIPVAELNAITTDHFNTKYIRQNTYGLQLKTTIILDSLLPSLIPDDAFALIAFTLQDLYPDDDWNFVFGQASLEDRVGVWSMARLGNYNLNDKLYALCRQRTLNVAVHETGHIFGIKHCVHNECCMNGSNSLEESDQQPSWLCWECLAKVCMNRNINPATHLKALLGFHRHITKDTRQIQYYRAALDLLSQ